MHWIKQHHRDYLKYSLDRSQVASDPWQQFANWYAMAQVEEIEPEAMCLCTSTAAGIPSARMVLMKGFSCEGLCFFTNYDSRKSKELVENPNAVAVFYWPRLERQVTLECRVEVLPPEISDEYFYSRSLESQVAACVSQQGKPVESREQLLYLFNSGMEKAASIRPKRPPWWGGYRLKPHRFEFWQGRAHRLHDRFEFLSDGGDKWKIQRLCP